jgi:hypothetical protein
MFVLVVTSSKRMQRNRNYVRRLSSASLAVVNMLFSGSTSNSTGGGLDEKIKKVSDLSVKRRKAFLDQATISPEIEITAFQILHQQRPR